MTKTSVRQLSDVIVVAGEVWSVDVCRWVWFVTTLLRVRQMSVGVTARKNLRFSLLANAHGMRLRPVAHTDELLIAPTNAQLLWLWVVK